MIKTSILQRILCIICAFATLVTVNSCYYDDTDVRDSIKDLTERVEDLEKFMEQVSEDIESLNKLIEKLQSEVTIDDVRDNGDGYTVNFSDGTSITIYDGEDGEDGMNPPAITVVEEDGVYYWALEGENGIEYILDKDGNKIPVNGNAPQVRINDEGTWEISTDGGLTWEDTGMPAYGDGGTGGYVFNDVTEDDNYVYFTLRDGTVVKVPKTMDLSFSFGTDEDVLYFEAGESRTLDYQLSGASEVTITKPNGWRASIESEGFVITAPSADNVYAEKEGVVSVLVVSANGQSLAAEQGVAIAAPAPVLTLTSESEVSFPKDGGDVSITYAVENARENGVISAKSEASWLTFDTATPGRVLVTASANADDATRTAVVTVVYTYDGGKTVSFDVAVTQSMYDYEFDLPYLTGSYYGDDYSVNDGEMMYQLYLTNNEELWQYGGAYYWISILSGEPSDMNAIAPAVGTYTMSPSAGSDIAGMNTVIKSTDYTIAYVYPDASVGGTYYAAFFSWGELELTYENGEYHLDAVLTDTRNNTHHITYTGPIVCTNFAQPDEPDEPENPDAISLLTEDLTIDWPAGFLASAYYWGENRYAIDVRDNYSYDHSVQIEFYCSTAPSDNGGYLPGGSYTIADSKAVGTALVGTLTESTFGGVTLTGSWVYPRSAQSAYSGDAAPLVEGTVDIVQDGQNYTLTVNAVDDAGNKITVSAGFTANEYSVFDMTAW